LKIKEQIRQEESILNMHVCNGKPRNTIKEKQSERDTSTTKAVHDSIPLSVVSSAARQTVNQETEDFYCKPTKNFPPTKPQTQMTLSMNFTKF
jgi:septin family protein